MEIIIFVAMTQNALGNYARATNFASSLTAVSLFHSQTPSFCSLPFKASPGGKLLTISAAVLHVINQISASSPCFELFSW